MTIPVELADGRRLEFPDGTSVGVIQNTVKRLISGDAPQKAMESGAKWGPLDSIAQGAMMGWADEAKAAITAAKESLRGGLPFGQAYDQALSAYRGAENRFADESPVTNAALNIGAGILTPIPGAAEVMGAKSLAKVPAFLKAAGVGAGVGGVAGAGSAEDDRMTGAATGAGIGAGLGAALSPVASLAGKGVDYVASKFSAKAPLSQAQELVVSRLRDQYGDDFATIAAQQLQKLGPEATLADLGTSMNWLAKAASNQPSPTRDLATNVLQGRQEGQGERIMSALNKGLKPDEFFGQEVKLLESLKTNANKAYDEARKAVPYVGSPGLDDLLQRPSMKDALGGAMRNAADEGRPFGMARKDGRIMRAEDFNKGDRIESLTLEAVDDVKKALDDGIRANINPITGEVNNRGRILTKLKNDFLDMASAADTSGKYAAARAQYAGDLEVVQALRAGKDFMKAHPNQIARDIGSMSFAEKDAFRTGVYQAVMDIVDKADDGVNAVRRVFGNQMIRNRLEPLFDSSREFKQFAKAMENEAAFYRTRQAAMPGQGSQTQGLTAEQESLQKSGNVLGKLLTGDFAGAAKAYAMGKLENVKGLNPKTAEQLGPILFTQGVPENQAILQSLKAKSIADTDKKLAAIANQSGLLGAAFGYGGGRMGGLLGSR